MVFETYKRRGELASRESLKDKTNMELADIIVQLLMLLSEYESELTAAKAARNETQ